MLWSLKNTENKGSIIYGVTENQPEYQHKPMKKHLYDVMLCSPCCQTDSGRRSGRKGQSKKADTPKGYPRIVSVTVLPPVPA